jgi:hypothetical protein
MNMRVRSTMCRSVEVFSDNLGVSEVSGSRRNGDGLKKYMAGVDVLICGVVGSGSTYVYGYCDATYKEKMNEEETVTFVKNSECNIETPVLCLRTGLTDLVHSCLPNSLVACHEPRWIIRWMCPYVCYQEGRCAKDLYSG